MAFKDDWKAAKKKFEDATKKKKPSEKFIGAFRSGTGIESALAKVDSLIAAKSWSAAVVAHKDFTKAATAYIKTAKDATVKDPSYATCSENINVLVNDLRQIGDDISDEIKKNEANMEVSAEDLIGKTHFAALCKGGAVDSDVAAFAQAKWFVNPVTQAADGTLSATLTEFNRHRQKYLAALKEVRDLRGASFSPRSEGIKMLKSSLGDMLESLGAMGMLGEVATYVRHQNTLLKNAPNKDVGKPYLKAAEKAAAPLNAEVTSLTKVELFLDNLKA